MSHEIVNGTQLGRGYEIHSCLKNGATKISGVLDNGYNSFRVHGDHLKERNMDYGYNNERTCQERF